jgi:small basic protein
LTPHAYAAIAALAGICTALAFVVFFALIKEVGATRALLFTYVNPAVALVAGVLLAWVRRRAVLAGVLLGLALKLSLPIELARYTAVGILAALDSLLGALRAELEGHFDTRIFLSGFYTNALLAAGLAFLGDRLGIDLYLVALFAFGWRIFQNVAVIRRHFL